MRLDYLLVLGVAACGPATAEQHRGRVEHSPPLVALTSNGPIVGHISPDDPAVIEYLGVPYAQPPTGKLRFKPARQLSRRRFHNASSFGYDCPAPPTASFKYPGLTPQAPRILKYFTGSPNQDEDCLTLNIWRPHRPDCTTGFAVLVHFYGGRFTTGTTDTPYYYGQGLASSQGVIVVTVNFRINIFGYPGIPGQVQNLGLRDQRAAVEWVQRNIKAFGGDSARIVISGQSAGAVAVDYWSYAYVKNPIVRGLISHSGTALSFPLIAAATATKNWYNVSGQLGCGTSGDTLACMQSKRWQDIETIASKFPTTSGGSPLRSVSPFYPVVDNETVFADYEARSDDGAFSMLPYLLGNNDYEQGYYALSAYSRGVNTTRAEGDAFLLSSFTCPNTFEASNRRRYGVPVWLWRYFGDWENLRLYSTSGAYHGADVEMIFGNDELAAWGAFIRDPERGLSRLGYPTFDPTTDSLIRFAYGNEATATFVSPGVYASSCGNVTLGGVAV